MWKRKQTPVVQLNFLNEFFTCMRKINPNYTIIKWRFKRFQQSFKARIQIQTFMSISVELGGGLGMR